MRGLQIEGEGLCPPYPGRLSSIPGRSSTGLGFFCPQLVHAVTMPPPQNPQPWGVGTACLGTQQGKSHCSRQGWPQPFPADSRGARGSA